MTRDVDRLKVACAGCGRPEHSFALTKITVIRPHPSTGVLEQHVRPCCAACIRERGALVSDRATRDLLSQTVDRVLTASVDLIVADLKAGRT